MPYDILNRLAIQGKLQDCSITFIHKNSADKKKTIQGRDITEVSRSGIEYSGGEAGKEHFRLSFDLILGIELNGKPIFRKAKRVERIYPRA